MDIIFFALVLVTISVLGYFFGADSRQLTDNTRERDSLWSR